MPLPMLLAPVVLAAVAGYFLPRMVRFVLQQIEQEIEHRRAEQKRIIRMQALLDTERDCRRLGIEPSDAIKAEIAELFTGAQPPNATR